MAYIYGCITSVFFFEVRPFLNKGESYDQNRAKKKKCYDQKPQISAVLLVYRGKNNVELQCKMVRHSKYVELQYCYFTMVKTLSCISITAKKSKNFELRYCQFNMVKY